jgi:adenosine deaminase
VFEDLQATKYQMAEYRISIYGRSRGEWDKLAKWVVNNKLFSDNVRWLIQIPRLYEVFKAGGTVQSFGDVIQSASDAFLPLCPLSRLYQTSSSLCLKSPKIHEAIPSCTSSCSVSLASTV